MVFKHCVSEDVVISVSSVINYEIQGIKKNMCVRTGRSGSAFKNYFTQSSA